MIWKYIKADVFFKEQLPGIKSYKHKIRGKNSRGNPVDFSPEEKKKIVAGLTRLFKEIKSSIK